MNAGKTVSLRGLVTAGAAAGSIFAAHLLLPISVSPMIVGLPVSFVSNVGVRDPTHELDAVNCAEAGQMTLSSDSTGADEAKI